MLENFEIEDFVMKIVRMLSIAVVLANAAFAFAQNEPSRTDVFQWLRQARAASMAGEKDKARKLIDDSRSWASKNKDKLAGAWADQLTGELEFSAGDRAKAVTAFTAALDAFGELKNEQGIANCRLNLGRLAFAEQKLNDALQHQTIALESFRKLNRSADEAAVLSDLAATQKQLGKVAEAKQSLQQAWSILGNREGTDPASKLRVLGELASCCEATNEPAEAIKHFTAAITLAGDTKQPAEEARLRNSLGSLHQRQGNLEEAGKQYEAALKTNPGSDPATEAAIRNNLGALLQEQGKIKEALVELQKALALFEQQKDDAGQGRTLYNIALAYETDGKNADAIVAYEKAATLRRKIKDDAGAARVLDNLALLYASSGKADKAKECRDEAERLRSRR